MDRNETAAVTGYVYGPRRKGRVPLLLVIVAVGAFLVADGVGLLPSHKVDPVGIFLGGIALLGALTYLVAVLRGVPRLKADRYRLTIDYVFSRTSAPWRQLGPFTLKPSSGAKGSEASASAPLLNESGKLLRLHDVFDQPLGQILLDLGKLGAAEGQVAMAPMVVVPVRQVGIAGFRFPWLTTVLLAAMAMVFILETAFAPGSDVAAAISPTTLLAMGGLSRREIASGEVYRLFTAVFLHSGLAHLLGNGFALALAGWWLERMVGRAWMFCIFSLGALAGSAVSLALLAPNAVAVGASGGIMALLAALFAVSFREERPEVRTRLQVRATQFAVPALIPFGHAAGGIVIDYGAHAGGAVFGGLLGWALLANWPKESPLPALRQAAAVMALVLAMGIAASFVVSVRHIEMAGAALAKLIPDAQYPRDQAVGVARASYFVAAFPEDPRSHFFMASSMFQRQDMVGAEKELRSAVALAEAAGPGLRPAVLSNIRGTFALVVAYNGHADEARGIARPVCAATGDAAVPAPLMTALNKGNLCAGTR